MLRLSRLSHLPPTERRRLLHSVFATGSQRSRTHGTGMAEYPLHDTRSFRGICTVRMSSTPKRRHTALQPQCQCLLDWVSGVYAPPSTLSQHPVRPAWYLALARFRKGMAADCYPRCYLLCLSFSRHKVRARRGIQCFYPDRGVEDHSLR